MAVLDLFDLDHNDPDKISIPLNFSSVDYRDIGSRKGSFSRTIKLPSTKSNDAFFGLSFEVTNEGLFNDKIKIPITINEIEFFGFMQLNGVSISKGKTDSYSINIFSDLVDWTALIGVSSIRDLNHYGNHVYSIDNIEDSWDNTPLDSEYVYPLIDYGNYLNNSPPVTSEIVLNEDSVAGFDNVLTVENNNIHTNLQDWYPAFFVYPIIKEIFKEIGYKFTGEFIKDDNLVNLILPFVGEQFTARSSNVDISQDTLVRQELDDDPQSLYGIFGGTVDKTFYAVLKMADVENDPGERYNPSTGQYIAKDTGRYDIQVRVEFDLINSAVVFEPTAKTVVYIQKVAVDGTVTKYEFPDTIDLVQVHLGNASPIMAGSVSIDLKEGDSFKLYVKTYRKDAFFFDFRMITGLYIIDSILTEVVGGVIEHKEVIQDIKKLDLLKEVISLGNYRIVTDTKSKTVDFVPEDKFFRNSPKDWTYKKDNSKKIDISLIRNDGSKILIWDYNNDTTDTLLEVASVDNRELTLGREEIDLESEHRSGVQNVHKSIFSSTITGRTLGLNMPKMKKEPDQGVINKIENRAVTGYPVGSLDTGKKNTNFANRILLWGGLRTGVFFNDGSEKTEYPFSFFTSGITLSYGNSFSGVGRGVSVSRGIVTENYTQTIKRLNESKMYKGFFWLDVYDITTLDFGRPIIVDDVQYYINKVIDYRVGANKPTLVELISRV